MNRVAKHLYLSSCDEAENFRLLVANDIKAIVSIGLGLNARFASKGIRYHLIEIEDDGRKNLLESFDDAVEFIFSNVVAGNNVLVHCVAGVSRSPTIVAAYLMRSENLNVQQALDLIKQHRSFICPNPGFCDQLEVYHRLNCKVDKESDEYLRFMVKIAAEEFQTTGSLPGLTMSSDPSSSQPSAVEEQYANRFLRCRLCRRTLAKETSILAHEPGVGQAAFAWRKRDKGIRQGPVVANSKDTCNSYCTDPMEWMTEVSDGLLEGKITCPNESCASKLDSFAWAGIACSCGQWIAPAFMLSKQKVDMSGGIVMP